MILILNGAIQAFSLIAARIDKKLADSYDIFTRSLFEVMFPQYLRHFPSCSVVSFEELLFAISGRRAGQAGVQSAWESKERLPTHVLVSLATRSSGAIRWLLLSAAPWIGSDPFGSGMATFGGSR